MKISVVIPFHWMENWQYFLTRCLASIEKQTFTDYEVVLIKHSTMPVTSNRVIESAKGELIKILYMDDYLAHKDSLKEIVAHFTPETRWLATGCVHDFGDGQYRNYHTPTWSTEFSTGKNTIGSPSVVTLRREGALLFDTNLSWLLDCDLYQRLGNAYGPPTLLDTPNVTIGIHKGQMTNILTEEQKASEHDFLLNKRT